MVSIPKISIPKVSIPNVSVPNLGGLTPSASIHSSRPSGITTSIFGILNIVSIILLVLIGRGNLGVNLIWISLAILGLDVVGISLLDFGRNLELIGVFFAVLNVVGVSLLISTGILEYTAIGLLALLTLIALFELPRRVTIKP